MSSVNQIHRAPSVTRLARSRRAPVQARIAAPARTTTARRNRIATNGREKRLPLSGSLTSGRSSWPPSGAGETRPHGFLDAKRRAGYTLHPDVLTIVGILPARYASVRFPGKPLAPLAGKPMILHVLEAGRAARRLSRVAVATDDERIAAVVRGAGGEAILTSPDAASGTDRLAEAARSIPADVYVNIQGDEPPMSPENID